MSPWNLILVLGVTTIWLAMISAVFYLVAAGETANGRRAALMRARGLEPPRTFRPSGT